MCTTPLAPDQKLDALKFVSQTHRALHDQRRKHETQAFFTTVTLFAIMAVARFTGKAQFPDPLPPPLLVGIPLLIAIIAGVSILYLHGIHNANQVNKDFAQRAEDCIIEILKDNGADIHALSPVGKAHAITRVWQAVMIVVLGFAAALLLIYG